MKLLLLLVAAVLAQQHRLDVSGSPVQLLRAAKREAHLWMQLSIRGDAEDPKETRLVLVLLFGVLACLTCLLCAHVSLRLVGDTQSKFYQTRLVHLQRNFRSREYYKSLYPKFFETM